MKRVGLCPTWLPAVIFPRYNFGESKIPTSKPTAPLDRFCSATTPPSLAGQKPAPARPGPLLVAKQQRGSGGGAQKLPRSRCRRLLGQRWATSRALRVRQQLCLKAGLKRRCPMLAWRRVEGDRVTSGTPGPHHGRRDGGPGVLTAGRVRGMPAVRSGCRYYGSERLRGDRGNQGSRQDD